MFLKPKYLILISYFFLSWNLAFGQDSDQLKNSTVLTKYFTGEQIEELIGILDYMDSVVLDGKISNKKIRKFYWQNLNDLLSANYYSPPFFAVDNSIDKITSLDKTLFEKIWQFRTVKHTHEGYIRDSVLLFTFKWKNSSYLNLIEEIEKTNTNLKDYLWSIKAAGDISLQITFRGYHDFNPANPVERLIMSIDILTFNIPPNYCPYKFKRYNKIKLMKETIYGG